MVENKTGSIINISSMAAFRPLTKRLLILQPRQPLLTLLNGWRFILIKNYSKNLRVNAIAPGFLILNKIDIY